VKWGATLAVEEINAKGGVAGRKLEAFFADNKAQPGEAVSAVRKLADVDQVDVIIGQTHSGACLGAMPVVKEIGVPDGHRGLLASADSARSAARAATSGPIASRSTTRSWPTRSPATWRARA
jgi:branched-chain amino acid transport system substrate-binding protein